MKKFILLVIGLFIILAGLLYVANIAKDTLPELIFVKEGDIIPENICKNLGEIIFVEKTGCPACAIVKPRIKDLQRELILNIKYYNLASKKDSDELISKSIMPRHVPTLIKDCKVYVGALSEEELREILK